MTPPRSLRRALAGLAALQALLLLFIALLPAPAQAQPWGEAARERRQLQTLEELLRQNRLSEAQPLMIDLAEKGHVDVQIKLAEIYFRGELPANGLGQTRGPQGEPYPDGRAWAAIARSWLERAVRQPSATDAQAGMAWYGIGMSWCCWPRFSPTVSLSGEEWSAAVNAFEQSVARGEPAAMLKLAELYGTGKGVARNDARAMALLERLASSTSADPATRAKGQQMTAALQERSRQETRQAADNAAAAARQAELDRAAQEARRQQMIAYQEAERRRAEQAQERERVEREQARLAREREERERPAREAAERARAQAQQAEEQRREREQARICDDLRALCPRLVFAGKTVVEDIANRLSVYPGSIRLDRVTLDKDFMGCSCKAVFWTPGGTLSCTVRQYSGLTVTAVSGSGCSR
jgi:TPR repeat protein